MSNFLKITLLSALLVFSYSSSSFAKSDVNQHALTGAVQTVLAFRIFIKDYLSRCSETCSEKCQMRLVKLIKFAKRKNIKKEEINIGACEKQ